MTRQIYLHLLGPVGATCDGRPAEVSGRRVMATLAALGLEAPHVVNRDRLIDMLWGERPPRTAVNSLQGSVSALRRALDPKAVVTADRGYVLGGHVVVDTALFEGHLARAAALRASAPERAHHELGRALQLWRGAALSGLEDFPFAQVSSGQWEERRLLALEQRLELDLSLGRHREAVSELDALVRQFGEREPLWALQVRALGLSGRQEEALATYQRARIHLRDDLGVDPGAGLRAAYVAVLNQEEPQVLSPTDRAEDTFIRQIVSRAPPPHLLGETRGRREEVDSLVQALTASVRDRLVTITGAGGVGKTRLALEVAHAASPAFRHGVVFVHLAEAQLPQDVLPTICAALGIDAGTDPSSSLRAAMHDADLLMVCDNAEHVLDAAPELGALVEDLPGLRMLVTSRASLDLPGERCYPINPLAVGGESGPGPAVDLFVDRLRAADPRLLEECHDADVLADICTRCDGLPLALEFAAARAPLFGLAALRAELMTSASRLSGRLRGVPPRHRSLEMNLAWSIDQLEVEPRALLQSLFVFEGGFTLPAAAAVAEIAPSECEDALSALLHSSLIRRTMTMHSTTRYELLQTTRDHLKEACEPDTARVVRSRHAEYYRRLCVPALPGMQSPQRPEDWWAVVPERANIRAAIRFSIDIGSHEVAADLVLSTYSVWDQLGPVSELRDWLAFLLESTVITGEQRVDILLCWNLNEDLPSERVRQSAVEARELAETLADPVRGLAAHAQECAAGALLGDSTGDLDAVAVELDRRAVDPSDDLGAVISGMLLVGMAYGSQGSADQEREHLRRGLQLALDHEAVFFTLDAYNNLAEAALFARDAQECRNYATQGLQFFHDAWGGAAGTSLAAPEHGRIDLLSQLGVALASLGDRSAGLSALAQALDGHLRIGSRAWAGEDLLRVSHVIAHDDPVVAGRLYKAYEMAREREPWTLFAFAARLAVELRAELEEAGVEMSSRGPDASTSTAGGALAILRLGAEEVRRVAESAGR